MPPQPTPPLHRFWPKIDRSGECWIWLGAVHRNGYGKFYFEGRVRLAHRVAYEMFVGAIPTDLELDHLCRVPACVNPDHLEPVTRRENQRRGEGFIGQRITATHCVHGHEFTTANTYVNKRGGRECRRCHADREHAYRQGAE
jgi:hypothetical protein